MIELAFKTKPMAWSVKTTRNGRLYITPAYRKWKETIAWEAKAQIKAHPEWDSQLPYRTGHRLFVFFREGQRSDGVNRFKAVEDALAGICYDKATSSMRPDDHGTRQGCWEDLPETAWFSTFGNSQILVRLYPP